MRIAQIAPLAESVPPKLYGGTERVVSWLTEELVALGHEVTLFASGDSVTTGTLVPIVPKAIRLSRPRPDPFPAYAAQLDAIARAASDFDVLHSHIDWLHLPLLGQLGVPHLTTLHNRLDTPDLPALIRRFPSAQLISISDHHRVPLPTANWLGTVYHGMPPATLEPSYATGRYLVFLGRLTREKGPEAAIHIARATGMRLRMAAKVLAIAIVLSAAGILNTVCLGFPFVVYAMAKDGVFFAAAGKLDERTGRPALAVMLQGALSCAAVLLGASRIDVLLTGIAFADWSFHAATALVHLRVRRRPADVLRAPAFMSWAFFLIAAAVALGSLWQRPLESAYGAIVLVVGIGVWWLWRR